MDNKVKDIWEFNEDSQGMWRWKLNIQNGRIRGVYSQGYKNKEDCIINARKHGYID
ncbi:DUF1508 domain-containing protein [Pseudobacteroides cellulosolvens]|uniref:DUF1508 domain-containing protein n=1 Tax=Pseudobacteroides cellulosolvens ATCC 35603 = DSM 2933 TaxID=398512 RepID=A0A0L6JR52_9FIRM|nr:DUF1508 domain-containing protein [Pseudobacteroides cellulosolvens]KNY28316.1 protein of unknown function DUF1508 [Pseudobacteroides cellulosolvens ATCC 35603 = DSM 2933]